MNNENILTGVLRPDIAYCYDGAETDTSKTTVNSEKKLISVDVKKLPHSLTIHSGDDTYIFDGSLDVEAIIQGGSRTVDYVDIINKPSINNIELIGDKSLEDLGIIIPTKTSDLTNDGDGVYPFLTQHQSLAGYATESWVLSKNYITESYHDSTKQDTISDLSTIRSGALKGNTSVQPSDISDMATQTWVGSQIITKQDVISDLQSIRSGALLGSSALQPGALAGYATESWVLNKNYITSSYHDASKQDTISDLDSIRDGAAKGVIAESKTTELSDNLLVEQSERKSADEALGNRLTTAETKLTGIEAGAQVNKIETIKLNDSIVTIIDKQVDLGSIVTSAKIEELETRIGTEESRAKGVEEDLDSRIDALEEKEVTIKSGEKILDKNTDKELYTTLSIAIEKKDSKDYIVLKGINGAEVASVDASAFVKDGMIENVELVKKEGNTYLKITFNTESGKQPIELDVSELIDVYTNGNGLNLVNNQFSVKVDSTGEFLSVSANGVKVSGVSTAIENAVKAEEERAEAIEESITNNLNSEINRATGVEESLGGRLTTVESNKVDKSSLGSSVADLGFTKNKGTVISVNNTQPDVTGNITLAIPVLPNNIPECPTTSDGQYRLICVVTNGVGAYSWIKDTTVSI